MYKNIKGFSLVELLVVVLIIGVLASVATASYSSYMGSSVFTALKTQLTKTGETILSCAISNKKNISKCNTMEKISFQCPNGAKCKLKSHSIGKNKRICISIEHAHGRGCVAVYVNKLSLQGKGIVTKPLSRKPQSKYNNKFESCLLNGSLMSSAGACYAAHSDSQTCTSQAYCKHYAQQTNYEKEYGEVKYDKL